MYSQIPPSSGYQNTYPYGAQRSAYGYQGYNRPNGPAAPSAPNSYQNQGSIYGNNQNSLTIDDAFGKSSYPNQKKDIIKDFLIINYYGNKEAKVYCQPFSAEKTFVIEYTLPINFMSKVFNINLWCHIPLNFPSQPPEIFIDKKPRTGLNKTYKNGAINEMDFKINLDKFGKFDPNNIDLNSIIDNIRISFNNDFPIYKDTKLTQNVSFGKNNVDKTKLSEIRIESDTFNDNQISYFMKRQVKDIMRAKYIELNQKYKTQNNYNELMNINSMIQINSGNNNNPMAQEIEKLKQIKNHLYQIEDNLQRSVDELQNGDKNGKNALQKCEEYIKIKDEKDMEYVVMKKCIEDYLVYLKKGYEKRAVDFHDMVEQTRMLSRELFSIDYIRKQRKNYYY